MMEVNDLKKEIICEKLIKKTVNSFMKECSFLNEKSDKDFNKKLIKLYDKICKSFKNTYSEYVFLDRGLYTHIPEIQEIIHILVFRENFSIQEKIKFIKGLDIHLHELIYAEAILINIRENILFTKLNNESQNEIDQEIAKVTLLLNTLTLILCIKYNYSKYDIEAFTDTRDVKKSFTGYKFVSTHKDLIVLFNKNELKESLDLVAKKLIGSVKNKIIPLLGDVSEENLTNILFTHIEPFVSRYAATKKVLNLNYIKSILGKDLYDLTSKGNLNFNINANSLSNINVYLIDSEIILNRKVLLPYSGVLLLTKDKDTSIESILIKEMMVYDGINNLITITKYKNGQEVPNIITLKNSQKNKQALNVQLIADLGSEYSKVLVSYLADFFKLDLTELFALGLVKMNEKLNYEVISPKYWKYRDRNYQSSNDNINHKGVVIKREFEIDIAPFIRKIHGEASDEAKAFAKKVSIKLDDGYTIVKPHTRVYGKVK